MSLQESHEAPEAPEAPEAQNAQDTGGVQDVQAAPETAGPEAPAKAESAKAPEAPEAAPDLASLHLPEGTLIADEVLGAFAEVAKDSGLSATQAQQVLDEMAPLLAQQQALQLQAVRATWVEDARADSEFGGAALAANLQRAQRAMTQIATPELASLLDESGLGDHPEVIRLFHRISRVIGEDSALIGRAQRPQQDPADILFGSSMNR